MTTMIEQENITYKRFAYLLIIVGLLLAADSYFRISIFLKLWPILVFMLGVGFIGIFTKQKRRGFTYLVIGIYLMLFTGLALYCNFTSWGILSVYWPIFITFLGLVFISIFIYKKATRVLLFFGLAMIFLSLYFIIIFSLKSDAWWSIFLLMGLSILLSRIKK